jgi:ankyrin repeat protein
MFRLFCCRKKPQPITPAMIARSPHLTYGELLAIKSLLENKSNIQGVDSERKRNLFHSLNKSFIDCCILDVALFEPYRPVMKSLLEARDFWGSTPLHMAIGSNNTKKLEWMLTLYLSFNADCNVLDCEGSAPIFSWIGNMYRFNCDDKISVLNDHFKLLFKMQINCFRVTNRVEVDGVEKNLTPLEYAQFRELERPDEIPQHLKVSTTIEALLKRNELKKNAAQEIANYTNQNAAMANCVADYYADDEACIASFKP